MSNEINQQLSDLLGQFNLVAFKLQTLSESFDKLITKVDDMTERISETKERQLVDRQSIEVLQTEVKDLEKGLSKVNQEVVQVKISMAEKLAWGSLGGGISAGLIKIIEIALGG